MPLKGENKSNAVYNDFKSVWDAQNEAKSKSTTKEAKPLLDGVPNKDKTSFSIPWLKLSLTDQ